MSNLTQVQASDFLYEYTLRTTVPLFLLETTFYGAVIAASSLYGYLALSKGFLLRRARVAKFVATGIFATMATVHWALSLRRILDILRGRVLPFDNSAIDPLFLNEAFGGIVLETGLFAHWASQIAFNIHRSSPADLRFEHLLPPDAASVVFLTVNILLSDAIVLWRMCILWRKNIVVLTLAVMLWLATLGSYDHACSLRLSIVNINDEITMLRADTEVERFNQYLPFQPAFSETALGSATLALSLVSNVASTSLISWKAWFQRKQIREYLSSGSRRTFIERFMALLVESSLFYCALWEKPECQIDVRFVGFLAERQEVWNPTNPTPP
ncbi:hypothetical protein K488DRAFT_75218, partial [Vararia minispora EC-137]